MAEHTDNGATSTDLSEDRTLLSNERTFASWVRTGLACTAVGIGLQAVFREVEPTWIAKSVASVFILIAVLVLVRGHASARRTLRRLSAHEVDPASRRTLGWITWLLVAAMLATAGLLWLI